jgi:hypothetical protein
MSHFNANEIQNALSLEWNTLAIPSKILISYGAFMILALAVTYLYSLSDERTIREVGVWVKPMKFMAATALFGFSTVWVLKIANSNVEQADVFRWISALIVLTSFFEVAYISLQASLGLASHYNNSDAFHALMFAVMGLAEVGLVTSHAWLDWEIWKEQSEGGLNVVTLGVILGLLLTFVLSVLSGFLLGGHQPPAGQGLPLVGWHFYKDSRPAHFLGVHAQQLIPLLGLFAAKFWGSYANQGLIIGSVLYTLVWAVLAWLSF